MGEVLKGKKYKGSCHYGAHSLMASFTNEKKNTVTATASKAHAVTIELGG